MLAIRIPGVIRGIPEVSTWEDPTHCTKFIISVAEELMDSDAFPGTSRPPGGGLSAAEVSVSPGKAKSKLEDPWLALQKLEDSSSQGRSVVVEADAFISSFATQAVSTPSPVQLPATSPKAAQTKRIRDVRSWQPQVPRFDCSRLSEEAATLEKSPMRTKLRQIPFRTAAEDDRQGAASDKLADVRAWKPGLVRCDSSTLEEALRERPATEGDPSKHGPQPCREQELDPSCRSHGFLEEFEFAEGCLAVLQCFLVRYQL
eukprot:s921_g6.t1